MTSTSQAIRSSVEVVDLVQSAHARVAGLVDGLTDAQARAASALPGWSRGHVITHLAELARAFTRQVDVALAGRTAEVYEGGRPVTPPSRRKRAVPPPNSPPTCSPPMPSWSTPGRA